MTRRPERPGHSELGACGYGPARGRLTRSYADGIRAFHRDRAQAGRLRIGVHLATHGLVTGALMQIDRLSTGGTVRAEVPERTALGLTLSP